ncbi:MAG: hypothetical protein JWO58_2556 [Chitinophagaceae bacterium]|nr:hypothetical protein [Chitinophagaceae bacterium]
MILVLNEYTPSFYKRFVFYKIYTFVLTKRTSDPSILVNEKTKNTITQPLVAISKHSTK